MTKEEIYIAVLENCLVKEGCFNDCPFFREGQMDHCRRRLEKKLFDTDPDTIIAAGFIKEGYIKPYTGYLSVAIPYNEVSLKPTEEKTQRVEWLDDIYFTVSKKDISYDIYDENHYVIYTAPTMEEAKKYINNLTIKRAEKEKI